MNSPEESAQVMARDQHRYGTEVTPKWLWYDAEFISQSSTVRPERVGAQQDMIRLCQTMEREQD